MCWFVSLCPLVCECVCATARPSHRRAKRRGKGHIEDHCSIFLPKCRMCPQRLWFFFYVSLALCAVECAAAACLCPAIEDFLIVSNNFAIWPNISSHSINLLRKIQPMRQRPNAPHSHDAVLASVAVGNCRSPHMSAAIAPINGD